MKSQFANLVVRAAYQSSGMLTIPDIRIQILTTFSFISNKGPVGGGPEQLEKWWLKNA